ncbi:MAG: cytochrome c-type biogenesis protein CcmH [Paracoccaceae bacterium]|jgi:cytochrome c-type biogenesis protein CcmH
MTFWIISLALGVVISALLAVVLLRTRPGANPSAAYDLRVYRDQLKDVDRDVARGLIGEADAERVRTEVSRRILAADTQLSRQTTQATRSGAPKAVTFGAVAVLAVVIVAGSMLFYRNLGAPGYGDLSLKHRIEMAEELRLNRPSQAEAEAQMPARPQLTLEPGYQALIDQLRATVAKRPGDMQGQALLARHEAQSGNMAAAHQAQAQVIAIMGAQAGATQYGELAELLILAAGGYVAPEAETALRMALERDPSLGPARYYWGVMLAQTGRPDMAFRLWDQTLQTSLPDAPWLVPIRGQIEEMAWRAGVEYTLPPAPAAPDALAGPTADDVEAAAGMSAEDQAQMVRSMVDRLSERLASEGGSPAEWARLIGALGILGEADRARAIHNEAQTVFAGDDAALAAIAAAARQAGLTP